MTMGQSLGTLCYSQTIEKFSLKKKFFYNILKKQGPVSGHEVGWPDVA